MTADVSRGIKRPLCITDDIDYVYVKVDKDDKIIIDRGVNVVCDNCLSCITNWEYRVMRIPIEDMLEIGRRMGIYPICRIGREGCLLPE